jgi:SAM-dependent methyltransferase
MQFADWRNVIHDGQLALSQTECSVGSVGQPASVPGSCPDFDGLAPAYRWMEWITFGPWLHWCRSQWLSRLAGCRRALVLGDGDGRFTGRLLRVNPGVAVDALDASPAMLKALLRRAGPHAARVRAHTADARSWRPEGQRYDLVVTHFFLDCLTTEEVRSLAATVRNSLEEGSLWVVSEFRIPPNSFGRLVARPLIAALYWAFGRLTGLRVRSLPDYASTLRNAGFLIAARRTWLGGLLISELWSAGVAEPISELPAHSDQPQPRGEGCAGGLAELAELG